MVEHLRCHNKTEATSCFLTAAFGFDHSLHLQSQQPEDLATTCNVVHALLVQRQRDVSQRAQFEDHFQRMRSDLNVSEQTRDRLRSQLDAKQREHGALLNQACLQSLCYFCIACPQSPAAALYCISCSMSHDNVWRPQLAMLWQTQDSSLQAA